MFQFYFSCMSRKFSQFFISYPAMISKSAMSSYDGIAKCRIFCGRHWPLFRNTNGWCMASIKRKLVAGNISGGTNGEDRVYLALPSPVMFITTLGEHPTKQIEIWRCVERPPPSPPWYTNHFIEYVNDIFFTWRVNNTFLNVSSQLAGINLINGSNRPESGIGFSSEFSFFIHLFD